MSGTRLIEFETDFLYKKGNIIIIQDGVNEDGELDVVSLTPEQVKELLAFIKKNKPPTIRLAKGRKAERKESK